MRWDFGAVSEGDIPNSIIVNINNVGKKELVIKGVQASLGCRAELISPQTLSPGDEGKMRVTFDPLSGKGVVEKCVMISSNDSNRPLVIFRAAGYLPGRVGTMVKGSKPPGQA